MTAFLIGSIALIVLAVLVVARPLLRKPGSGNDIDSNTEQSELTLNILRDQQAELEQERKLGNLDEAGYASAHAELQRRLVEELGSETPPPALSKPSSRPRRTAFVLIVLIPLLSSLGYAVLGNPIALQPGATAPQQQMTPDKIAAMVERLAQKQKDNPGDLDGWLRLAQAYKVMGRYADAASAYGKAESKVRADAGLLASYAEVLGMSANNGMKGKPTELINAALKLDPNQPHALLLAGAAAMERQDFNTAVTYWEKLLPMVEPGSEIEQVLRDSIDRIRNKHNVSAKK